MDQNFKKLQRYVDRLISYKLPSYNDIPSIPLYMEQVTRYINNEIAPLLNEENPNFITSYMINNYVKAKIVLPPSDKQYSRVHIGYFIFISLIKKSASLADIATFIELDEKFLPNKEDIYKFYKEIQDSSINEVALEVSNQLKDIEKIYEEDGDQDRLTLKLIDIALRLYIESESRRVIAESIMKVINQNILPEKALKEDIKEEIFENKLLDVEAKKLSVRKVGGK